ncbi:MAG: DUF5615 family PIN-like protein [Candidatus Bipolaricaulota bacterium]|nr:DUF5615 family PIN-like protein [Candidatus Bipolaricaulota bacterium]MDW8030760.1 DUF5615 family PIN-like protein [Candidatus Bipolaricaulota bacterium]
MRILVDENLPESLVDALRQLGHEVDSVNSLRLKGLDNSTLYLQAGFVHNVRQMSFPSRTKLLRVVLPQQAAKLFVESFVKAFQQTDWSRYDNGDDWP